MAATLVFVSRLPPKELALLARGVCIPGSHGTVAITDMVLG